MQASPSRIPNGLNEEFEFEGPEMYQFAKVLFGSAVLPVLMNSIALGQDCSWCGMPDAPRSLSWSTQIANPPANPESDWW